MGRPRKNLEEDTQEQNNISKIPKGEVSWTRCTNEEGKVFIITSKDGDRSMYFLYELKDNKLTKILKNKNPYEFDKIIFGGV